MQAVLDQLARLAPTPLETLTPQEARQLPTVADAVRAVLRAQGRSTAPEPVGNVQDTTIPGPAGAIPVRVYTPAGTGPFPVVVYYHGGGWVIANLDVYDSSARANQRRRCDRDLGRISPSAGKPVPGSRGRRVRLVYLGDPKRSVNRW